MSRPEMPISQSHTKTKPSPILILLQLGRIVENVNSARFLGLVLQSDLKWTNHIKQITSKANQSLLPTQIPENKL